MLTLASAMLPISTLRLETKNRSVSDAIVFLLSRCLQQSASHLFIAAPSAFDGEGHGVDVDETVTAGTRWNSDCFAHVADCCHCPFEHTPFLIVVEVIEPVGVADKFGNGTVGQGHGMRLPGRLTGVNGRPSGELQVPKLTPGCDADASRRVDAELSLLGEKFLKYSYCYHDLGSVP